MNSEWQLNRIGSLDFWYYDEQEFDFLDGRMLLRGANGSGKSVTMQSFIPLLLDGNLRPERLDPFGSRARKMENYLLEEGDEREERTGSALVQRSWKPDSLHQTGIEKPDWRRWTRHGDPGRVHPVCEPNFVWF